MTIEKSHDLLLNNNANTNVYIRPDCVAIITGFNISLSHITGVSKQTYTLYLCGLVY